MIYFMYKSNDTSVKISIVVVVSSQPSYSTWNIFPSYISFSRSVTRHLPEDLVLRLLSLSELPQSKAKIPTEPRQKIRPITKERRSFVVVGLTHFSIDMIKTNSTERRLNRFSNIKKIALTVGQNITATQNKAHHCESDNNEKPEILN